MARCTLEFVLSERLIVLYEQQTGREWFEYHEDAAIHGEVDLVAKPLKGESITMANMVYALTFIVSGIEHVVGKTPRLLVVVELHPTEDPPKDSEVGKIMTELEGMGWN